MLTHRQRPFLSGNRPNRFPSSSYLLLAAVLAACSDVPDPEHDPAPLAASLRAPRPTGGRTDLTSTTPMAPALLALGIASLVARRKRAGAHGKRH
ncbi:hypothetical protein [Chondromyces apiculatus]|uniref:Uncharacterized protein n=1 Tax=Chondromyces apiculatus DSM 436 TaxID=1192034 RepID=A0A017T8X9_9BACT|nr:hypothetical protein [Chondromyces apiculatus]EYF05694.1 Hypothetical protein CAP_2984 [Chondromyces apiculatus DSM 436]